ncbi:trypsin-like serine peptidase [Clavibacter zhangzhiyongii]|uniref:Serine protease n=1 Tax=Clavibacter zhangzhiyongii TaxID=2768071 RepID=A0A7L7Z3W5_9MICO|nr:serine protease [Clavibacter zhangzhiyongii]QOD44423.1 serine protease [Clavibacter zhangzhiyongii]
MRIRPRSTPAAPARPRRAVAALAVAGGLAAAVLGAPVAASAAPAGQGSTSATGASVVVAAADPASAAAHWTAERRRAALATDPVSPAADPSSASASALRAQATGDAPAAAPVAHPDQPFVGVLYYVADGRDRACTASVVDTPDGDAVATAAHCLVDRRTGAPVASAVFVPGAQGAAAPHGLWPVRVSAVSPAWTTTGRAADDAGFARVSGPAGEVLAASVGAAEPVFGSALVPATGPAPRLAILGYPAAGSAAATLEACAGRPQHAAGGQIAIPCTLGTGAAGSPVLTAAGEQRSVVARPSAGHGVLLATWGGEAQRALASLHGW